MVNRYARWSVWSLSSLLVGCQVIAGIGDSVLLVPDGAGAADAVTNARQHSTVADGESPPPNLDATGSDGATADVRDDTSDAEVASDATLAPDVPVISDAPPPCDPEEVPNREDSLFVSVHAGGEGTGSPERPLKTLAAALTMATLGDKKNIIVETGVYAESLVVPIDVTLQGGWRRTGGTWKRVCDPEQGAQAVLQSASVVALRVPEGKVTLRDFRIVAVNGGTKENGEGESTVGVWATGRSAAVQLIDVVVVAGGGGDGALAVGVVPPLPHVCSGLADCATGAAGPNGYRGADGQRGRFNETGHSPVPAESGVSGFAGKNGMPGVMGSASTECARSCAVDLSTCACIVGSHETRAGGPGTCGCGGAGGGGGNPGHNGGASVAVLVTGGARMVLDRVSLVAADGGIGTKGAEGSDGSLGTDGQSGASVECRSCGGFPSVCSTTSACGYLGGKQLAGGRAGTRGGAGGKGGSGGSGAGGSSIALVSQAGTVVVERNVRLTVGKGGPGGRPGLEGEARERLLEP